MTLHHIYLHFTEIYHIEMNTSTAFTGHILDLVVLTFIVNKSKYVLCEDFDTYGTQQKSHSNSALNKSYNNKSTSAVLQPATGRCSMT